MMPATISTLQLRNTSCRRTTRYMRSNSKTLLTLAASSSLPACGVQGKHQSEIACTTTRMHATYSRHSERILEEFDARTHALVLAGEPRHTGRDHTAVSAGDAARYNTRPRGPAPTRAKLREHAVS